MPHGTTIVAGTSGSGKSTFAVRYLLNAPLALRFLFDPEPGEFDPREGEFANRLMLPSVSDWYGLQTSLVKGWTCFDPHTMFPGQPDEAFAVFCEWVFAVCGQIPGEKVMVVDEAWKYITPRREPVELAQCVRSGRKRGLSCMFLTQTPHLLHASIRNECSELVCFTLDDDTCLAFPEQKGLDPDEVRRLPKLRFIARNCRSGGMIRDAITL